MRGSTRIHHRPYYPPTAGDRYSGPYICRLAPREDGFAFEWLDNSCDGEHTLYYGLRGSEEKTALTLTSLTADIGGLENGTEYEFFVEAENGRRSCVRLFRTAPVPDGAAVINYLHPEDTQYEFSGRYLCSPSLARVENGRLIAGMDLYGNRMAQNLTVLFYSDDDGKSWRYLTDLYPFYWGSLLYHRGVLYILGLTTEYGNLQIACSRDGGKTWSSPVNLFYGSNNQCPYGGMHRAPMHFTEHDGRLYTTCEYGCWTKNGSTHCPAILSVDSEADLMIPENWYCSDFMPFEGEWKKASGFRGDAIEGNIVLSPDGEMYSYMRWKIGSLLRLRIDPEDPEKAPEFAGILEAPVSNSMFRLIPKKGGGYRMITNRMTPVLETKKLSFSVRCVLSEFETDDLEHFRFVKDIFNYENDDPATTGFQYPTFIDEDGMLSLVIRTAYNGADNFHNSNYMLFYRM